MLTDKETIDELGAEAQIKKALFEKGVQEGYQRGVKRQMNFQQQNAYEIGLEDGRKFLYDYYFKNFKKLVIIEKEHLKELGFPLDSQQTNSTNSERFDVLPEPEKSNGKRDKLKTADTIFVVDGKERVGMSAGAMDISKYTDDTLTQIEKELKEEMFNHTCNCSDCIREKITCIIAKHREEMK